MEQPTHQPAWTSHPGVFIYLLFVFLETGYTLLLLPTGIPQILSVPRQRLPTFLVPYTALRSQGGILGTPMNLIRVRGWCCELSPSAWASHVCGIQIPRTMTPYCAPNRFSARWRWEAAALWWWLQRSRRWPLLWYVGPASSHAEACVTVNTENDLYKQVLLSSMARLAEKWFSHICIAGLGQLYVSFVYSWMKRMNG